MKKSVRLTYNALRAIVVTVIVIPVLLFSLAYLAMSLPFVQNKIKGVAEREVSKFLGTNVTIGKVSFSPFNEVLLEDVTIPDQQGDSLIVVDKLGAGVSIYEWLAHDRLTFTYGEIIGLHGRVTRPDADSPTNLQFIIDAFKPKDDSPPKPFDVQVFNVVIRKSDLRYDVLDKPRLADRFDPNHLNIYNLNADISLPTLRNNDFDIDLRRLTLRESSGLHLTNLTSHIRVTDSVTTVSDLEVSLPKSVLHPADITLRYNSLKTIGEDLKGQTYSLKLADSHVTPSDLSAFVPDLAQFDTPVDISLAVNGNTRQVDIPMLSLRSRDDALDIDIAGNLYDLDNKTRMRVDLPKLALHSNAPYIATVTKNFARLSPEAEGIITRCGDVTVDGALKGSLNNFAFNGRLLTSLGDVKLDGEFRDLNAATKHFAGTVTTPGFELGTLLDKRDLLGDIAADARVDGSLAGNRFNGHFDGRVDYVDFKGYRYDNIVADVTVDDKHYTGHVAMDDDNGRLDVDGELLLNGAASRLDATISAEGVNLATILPGVTPLQAVHNLDVEASLTGNSVDNVSGSVRVDRLDVTTSKGKPLTLNNVILNADNTSYPQHIELSTSFLQASVDGRYNFRSLVAALNNIVADVLPSLVSRKPQGTTDNDFSFFITVDPNEEFKNLVSLPVELVYRATVTGAVNDADGSLSLNVDAPYLLQGRNLIEETHVGAYRSGHGAPVTLEANTTLPSKKGKINLNLDADAVDDFVNTHIGWVLERETEYHGDVKLQGRLGRDASNRVTAVVDLLPTDVVVNDTVWTIEGGQVQYFNRNVIVNDAKGSCGKQYISIYGRMSDDPDDVLVVDLNDISLDYVFQTLAINNVDFGGRATGKVSVANVFSGQPSLFTPRLHVDALHYNGALMGDADIESHWLNDTKAVSLDCDLTQRNGAHSLIKGEIYTADDSLYLDFKADHANIEFMKPFMAAFTSDVRGEVSGHAILFGNFHTIDLKGDIHADSLQMKIDYTNVYYTVRNEDVHIVPGFIDFKGLTLYDREGHHAALNGWLKHDSFHNPAFNFTITEADDLLTYDITPALNADWYGTIYGDGSVIVSGEPGEVGIKVTMETAPRSKFTFVLSDTEEAGEFNFITFHDRNADMDADSMENEHHDDDFDDDVPEVVRQLKQRISDSHQDGPPTHFSIDLQADITPEAQLNLIMDPAGGDYIRAGGTGNLRLHYDSTGSLFEMFGKYQLDKGSYHFTLQDVIVRDFDIDQGSVISFNGDPYNAQIDIKAHAKVNANLLDLDESFAQDRDLNRTNVPVYAMLYVKGDLEEHDISFDIDVPTLSTEAKAKVKTAVNTDDQKSRQIIYLLTLGRFYTPDYMNSSTRSNEFTSVASTTITSKLSSMLGQLSDNWSIAPAVRTDRGDFSDVQVDVALSSQLLNNRLLLNGNFGYRDNTYNTQNTNFIGDFDLEYLLNRKGTVRLKAYNHFNDQNLYVRNAMTTQGVGIVFKHDFDHKIKSWRQSLRSGAAPADTINNQ